MNTDVRRPNYPYVSMNHLALMLFMIKHRLPYPKLAERLLGAQIVVMQPAKCPDNNTPLAAMVYGPGDVRPIDI